jgi:hypothetical protein
MIRFTWRSLVRPAESLLPLNAETSRHTLSLIIRKGLQTVDLIALWVAGVCPTGHREIHHGYDGKMLNEKLIAYVAQIEQQEAQVS